MIDADGYPSLWKSRLGDVFIMKGLHFLYGENYFILTSVIANSGYGNVYSKFNKFFYDFESVDASDVLSIGDTWGSGTGDVVRIFSYESSGIIKNAKTKNFITSISVETMENEVFTGNIIECIPIDFMYNYKKVEWLS